MPVTPRLAIRLAPELIARVDEDAERRGLDRSSWIRDAMEAYLAGARSPREVEVRARSREAEEAAARRDQSIAAMKEGGASVRAIAEASGLSRSEVQRVLDK